MRIRPRIDIDKHLWSMIIKDIEGSKHSQNEFLAYLISLGWTYWKNYNGKCSCEVKKYEENRSKFL